MANEDADNSEGAKTVNVGPIVAGQWLYHNGSCLLTLISGILRLIRGRVNDERDRCVTNSRSTYVAKKWEIVDELRKIRKITGRGDKYAASGAATACYDFAQFKLV